MAVRMRAALACTLVASGAIGLALQTAAADWPPRWWSRSEETVPGSRQKYYGGKRFPPQPRPVGEPAPFVHQYHYAHYWPYPLPCHDRASVRDVLQTQAVNGWAEETTLQDHHFDSATQQLNSAGKMHLRWILVHAPPQYRQAHVATGVTEQISQTRLASVQTVAAEMGRGGECPIALRDTQFRGTSAQYVDLMGRQWLSTIPKPRVNMQSMSGGSSGGGGASSGGGTSTP